MKKNLSIAAAVVACLAGAAPALAYGPEGLFGGRPSPDSTASVAEVVAVETRPGRAESVLQHPRSDYDPLPVSVGAFDFFPSLEAGASFDSNIYATRHGKKADGIFTLRPSVNAFSTWNRHALALLTNGDFNFYKTHDNENFNQGSVALQGRYDILNQTWLAGRAGFQSLSEPRTSPDAVAGAEPVTFRNTFAGVSAFRGAGILQARADYDLKRLDYDDAGLIGQSFRDRAQHAFKGKLTYVATANFRPYLTAGGNIRDYDHTPSRDSIGFNADAGVVWDFGGVTSLDVYIGWLSQDYARFTSNRINDGIDFGGRLTWNVTGLTTLALEANRSIEETTLDAFNSAMASGGSATLTHELLRNLLLEADGGLTRYDFHGNASRQDDLLTLGGGARWLINPNFYADAAYNWDRRVSTEGEQNFTKHIVTLRIGSQL